jgi:hypothetical protein
MLSDARYSYFLLESKGSQFQVRRGLLTPGSISVLAECLLKWSRLLEKTIYKLGLSQNLNTAWPYCFALPPTSRPSVPAAPLSPQRTQALRRPTPQMSSAPRTLRRPPPPALVVTPQAAATALEGDWQGDAPPPSSIRLQSALKW